MIHAESLTDLAASIRTAETSARTVIDHFLERSHRFQGDLNAYTAISDRAQESADHLDRRIAAGEDPGPLAGIPIALKDLIDEQGSTTTCGSSFYRHRAERSASVVARLEAAGAIIVGRTGLHEFAFGFSSENPWFGPVRNPYDPSTSPGGSSGGSAVATAAGLAGAAIGTDTGGSIRVPAALCGLFGLKVTHGRVPLTGVFPLAASLDTVGPLARSIKDLTVVYETIAGPDPEDPWSAPRAVASRTAAMNLESLRIGIPQPWVDEAPMSQSVREAFEATLDRLVDLGANVQEVRDPRLIPTRELADLINGEVASVHRSWLGDSGRAYGPEVAERLARSLEVTLEDYVAAQQWRSGLRHATARIFRDIDFLVTPSTGATRKVIGEPTIAIYDQPRSYRLVLSWFSSLVNHIGAPAIALPLPDTSSPGHSLQVIGPWWSEAQLLNLGSSLEERGLVGFRPPPGW